MVYSLGQELICENLTVQNIFKAEKVDSNMNVSGDITASQTMKCHTLKFDRAESVLAGASQAPDHFHKYEHQGSMVLRLYMMKMHINKITTTLGSPDVVIELFYNHNIDSTRTDAQCKFTGTFANDDVNGVTPVNGFKVNTHHPHSITPHATNPKVMTVTLSESATADGTIDVGFASVILEFPRWFYLDMAKQDGWRLDYGYVGPTASYN